MIEYYFFFNDNNEFMCEITEGEEQTELTEQEAIDELIAINETNFDHVRASNRLIRLNSEDTSVIISDLQDFYSYGYSEYIPDIMERVNKAIAKHQKDKHRNEVVRNLKVTCGKVACGTLIVTLLGTAAGALHKQHTNSNNFTNNIATEDFINEIPINLETVSDNFDEEYDQMIDELETVVDEYTESQNTIIEEKPIDTAYLRYDDLTNTNTYIGAYEDYYSIVEKYANKWGISPNIIMAMLTQESAGKKVNLMQIQFDSWHDQVLTEYDFVNGRYQSIVLTDTPEKYAGQNITVITREDLNNKVTNISVACVILRYCLEQMDFNVLAAIQAYNLGCPNMDKVMNETSRNVGVSVDDLLSDQTNTEFTNYTHIVDCGDPNYVTNVFRYLTDGEITIQTLNEDGSVSSLVIGVAQKQL